MSAGPIVRTEARDHVLLIAMNRPDKRNAIDQQMADELPAAFDTLASIFHAAEVCVPE